MWTLREAQRFTQSTAWPFSSPEADWLNVSLLLPMDGTNNSTVFTDAGPGARVVTANGNAKISTSESKFIGASAVFDGTGDFLSVANNEAFDFGTGDCVVEAWIYIRANSNADPDGNRSCCICSTWNTNATPLYGWLFGVGGNSTTTGTGLQFDSWNGPNGTLFRAAASISQSAWHHVAASVIGGTRRLYLDGVLLTDTQTITVGSGCTPINSLGNSLKIGSSDNSVYPISFNGYIDDLRITKGSGRSYSGATIPVPTKAFPTATSAAAAATPTPARVSGLQLWLDAADATTLFDATTGGSLVAADGTVARWEDKSGNNRHATQATSGSRPTRKASVQGGRDLLRFDGSDDFLSIASSTAAFNFLHDGDSTVFAVYKWTAPGSAPGRRFLLSNNYNNDSPAATTGVAIYMRNDFGDASPLAKLQWLVVDNGPTRVNSYTGDNSYPVDTFHVATIRSDPANATDANRVAFRKSGTVQANTPASDGASVPTGDATYDLHICTQAGTGGRRFAQCDLCELVMYDTALSDTNRSAVESYLMTKWGIA
jgi:hypothetical protein